MVELLFIWGLMAISFAAGYWLRDRKSRRRREHFRTWGRYIREDRMDTPLPPDIPPQPENQNDIKPFRRRA